MFTLRRPSAARRTLSRPCRLRTRPARPIVVIALAFSLSGIAALPTLWPPRVDPAFADSAAAAAIPGRLGLANSSVTIVNRDCGAQAQYADAEVAAHFHSGAPLPAIAGFPMSLPGIPGCVAVSWPAYVPAPQPWPKGVYAAHLSADRPVGALVHTRWNDVGATTISNTSRPGRDIVAPWVVNSHRGLRSVVTIQNTDDQAMATATLIFQDAATGRRIGPLTRAIPANGAVSVALNGAREIDLLQLPEGFAGSLAVHADRPVAVQVFTEWQGSRYGMAGTEGMPVEEAAARLFAPIVFNAGHAGRSWIAAANVGEAPVDLILRYRLTGPNCPAAAFANGGRPIRVAPQGSVVFDQGEPWSTDTHHGPSGLPAGCFGSAIIDAGADGRIVATVFAEGADGSLAGYGAMRESDGARQVVVPGFVNRPDMSTGIAAMNLSALPAVIELTVDVQGRPQDAPCPECRQTVAPWGAVLWSPQAMASLDAIAGRYGSARVRSDSRIGVVVTEASGNHMADTAMVVGIGEMEQGETPATIELPMLLHDAGLDDKPRAWTTRAIYLPGLPAGAR